MCAKSNVKKTAHNFTALHKIVDAEIITKLLEF